MPIKLTPSTHREYYQREFEIRSKVALGIPLTVEEKYLDCECLPDEALIRNDCQDELFIRLFHQFNPQFEEEIIRAKGKGEQRVKFERFTYEVLLKDWQRKINDVEEKDRLLNFSNIETRNELKKLSRDYILTELGNNTQEYFKRKLEIIAWSKFRYLSAKKIVDIRFTNGRYMLTLDRRAVVLDLRGLMHIIVGHFGAQMKVYNHDKSHFSEYFYHEDLPVQLQEIFTAIDRSGLYLNKLRKDVGLNFRFNGILYQLYFGKIKGSQNLRIKTFYPPNDLVANKLLSTYTEHQIGNTLFLYLKD